jgi:hypothetical protein
MKILWKEIKGTKGFYSINNIGQVKRNAKKIKVINHPKHNHRMVAEKVLKPCLTNGYPKVELTLNCKVLLKEYVHRLVAKAFIPNPHKFSDINHKDKTRINNYVENLEWCSRRYNILYSYNEIQKWRK